MNLPGQLPRIHRQEIYAKLIEPKKKVKVIKPKEIRNKYVNNRLTKTKTTKKQAQTKAFVSIKKAEVEGGKKGDNRESSKSHPSRGSWPNKQRLTN